MTENELYYFNDGYDRALSAVQKHIEILMNSNSDKFLLIAINTFVNTILHSRRTSDMIENKLLETFTDKK